MLNLGHRARAAAASLFLITSLALIFVVSALAQSDDDTIHLSPREKPAIAATEQLFPHAKPIRADVNVVLVPVTVTDTMNRPVLGLDKEDFVLYEGDQAQ